MVGKHPGDPLRPSPTPDYSPTDMLGSVELFIKQSMAEIPRNIEIDTYIIILGFCCRIMAGIHPGDPLRPSPTPDYSTRDPLESVGMFIRLSVVKKPRNIESNKR